MNTRLAEENGAEDQSMAEESRAADQRLSERIDALVSAIGEILKARNPKTARRRR